MRQGITPKASTGGLLGKNLEELKPMIKEYLVLWYVIFASFLFAFVYVYGLYKMLHS